jgi:hypothetical protein
MEHAVHKKDKRERKVRERSGTSLRCLHSRIPHIRATAKATPQKQSSSSKNILGVFAFLYIAVQIYKTFL